MLKNNHADKAFLGLIALTGVLGLILPDLAVFLSTIFSFFLSLFALF